MDGEREGVREYNLEMETKNNGVSSRVAKKLKRPIWVISSFNKRPNPQKSKRPYFLQKNVKIIRFKVRNS
jgi:hypothetical protein